MLNIEISRAANQQSHKDSKNANFGTDCEEQIFEFIWILWHATLNVFWKNLFNSLEFVDIKHQLSAMIYGYFFKGITIANE